MGALPLATRARFIALAATCAAALLATGPTLASAAPSGPSSPSGPSTSHPSSSAATTSPTARKPAATAPPPPADHGPPCTTNAGKEYPVVCLPDGSGEDQAASATPGDDLEFDAQVVNNGPAVADATVVINLPEGLGLESDEGDPVYRIDDWYSDDEGEGEDTDLTCQGGPSTITCSVGALATHANILVAIDLQVSEDAATGTTLSFGVALQPAGADTYATTSVSARINVLEPSNLVVGLTPSTLHTIVGHRATITGIVHNEGPGAAPDAVAVALALDEEHPGKTHFTITNGTDPGTLNGGTVLVIPGTSPSPLRARLQRHASGRDAASVRRYALPSVRFWPLGTIAPGVTRRVAIQLKALSVGTDTLAFGALSPAGDVDCADDGESGGGSDSGAPSSGGPTSDAATSHVPSATPLGRVPAAASTTTAPGACSFIVQTKITAIRRPAAAAPLADTGSHHLDAQLGFALSVLVLGGLLGWAGRRRAADRRHG